MIAMGRIGVIGLVDNIISPGSYWFFPRFWYKNT